MTTNSIFWRLAALFLMLAPPRTVEAQHAQANVAPRLHGTSDGFFEQTATSWSLQGRNFFFNFGGGANAAPQFGGANPAAGAQFGVGFGGGGLSGGLNVTAAQGSRRSQTMTSGSVTGMGGLQTFVGDVSQVPFVVGFTPVVGGGGGVPWQQQLRGEVPQQLPAEPTARESAPQADEPLKLRADPTDPPPAAAILSLDEIRRRRAAEQAAEQADARTYFEQGQAAEAAGKHGVARIHYQRAAKRAEGELRQQILARLQSLDSQ